MTALGQQIKKQIDFQRDIIVGTVVSATKLVMGSTTGDSPVYVVDKDRAATKLGSVLHVPSGHIKQLLGGDEVWVPIASPVSKEVGESVAELKLSGITVRRFSIT